MLHTGDGGKRKIRNTCFYCAVPGDNKELTGSDQQVWLSWKVFKVKKGWIGFKLYRLVMW